MGYRGVVKGLGLFFILTLCYTKGLSANTENKEIGQDFPIFGYCSEKFTARDEMGFTGTYYRCQDGSISYDQPNINIYNAREGLCSPTAGANILQMYCNACTTVECFDEQFVKFIKFFSFEYNLSSGTMMSSLLDGINKAWNSFCTTEKQQKYEWYLFHAESKKEYLQMLYNSLNWKQDGIFQRNINGTRETKWPLFASIDYLGTDPHTVTVVDIETDLDLSHLVSKRGSLVRMLANHQCWVRYNTWGMQYRASCYDFATWASYPSRGDNIIGRMMDQFRIIAPVEK